jgi:diguanylate cyclase (GGDEF)-like protein
VDGAAYLFLDLDDFKSVNDSPRSHHVGDQVLAALGERLQRSVRVTDAVGRRGGDEFMVLFNGVRDEPTAVALAERIFAAVTAPVPTDDGPKQVGVSIGVALAVPGRRDFEPDLRAHADTAMYDAKADGGGIRVWRSRTRADPRRSGHTVRRTSARAGPANRDWKDRPVVSDASARPRTGAPPGRNLWLSRPSGTIATSTLSAPNGR